MKIAEKNTSRKKSEIEKSLQLGMLLHRQTFVTASNAGGGDMEHRLALSRGDDCSALIALNKAKPSVRWRPFEVRTRFRPTARDASRARGTPPSFRLAAGKRRRPRPCPGACAALALAPKECSR